MHAKPQSGRAIEPGLVLRIVSKRGRTVMFGQTGLLFANRQWGEVGCNKYISLPVSATILRYVVSTWGSKSSTDLFSAYGDENGYVKIINQNGILSSGSAFYIAITK